MTTRRWTSITRACIGAALCIALRNPGLGASSALASEAAPADSSKCAAAAESETTSRGDYSMLGRGDKVKLSFYEVLVADEDRWGAERRRLQQTAKAFQLRSELSGEYVVQEDHAISIPILGSFPADKRRLADVQRQIECVFDAFLGHKGFVNVLSVVKPPVYVVGRVKTSGSVPFVPGMTVMHAISLSGGFENALLEPWQLGELTRETERLQSSLERASKAMARTVALATARTPESAKAPDALASVAGAERASALVAAESLVPRRQVRLRAEQESGLKAEISIATSELTTRKGKLPLLDQAVELRRRRFANLEKLSANGTLSQPELIRAQTELLDAQDRHEQTLASVDAAQERLERAQRELATRRTQASLTDDSELIQAHNDAEREATGSSGSINIIRSIVDRIGATSANDIQFTIIRQTDGGALQFLADEATPLEPGDLVQAKTKMDGHSTMETSRR